MPNWVYSGFNVTGDADELDRFRRMLFRTVPCAEPLRAGEDGTETIFDFNGILPMPPEAERLNPQAWAVENWGVKWNALDCDMSHSEGLVWFQFTTPWDFPTPVFEALAAEFPRLVFAGSSYEESHEWELTGEFNGDNDWGPGEIEWLVWTGSDDEDD